MSRHLYNVGEAVVLIPHWGHYLKTAGDYVVSAQMPPLGDELQYRIKCASEPYERVVAEHQLDRIEPLPPPREVLGARIAKRKVKAAAKAAAKPAVRSRAAGAAKPAASASPATKKAADKAAAGPARAAKTPAAKTPAAKTSARSVRKKAAKVAKPAKAAKPAARRSRSR